MSDLSRLLEDVYRSGAPGAAPSWASDDALDEVFADWVPGPPADAPEAERAYANAPEAALELAAALETDVAAEDEAPVDPFEPLQALLEAALRRAPDVEEPDGDEAAAEPEAVATTEIEIDLVEVGEPELVVVPDAEPAPPAPTPVRGWTRGDDDILPAGRSRRSLLLRRRR